MCTAVDTVGEELMMQVMITSSAVDGGPWKGWWGQSISLFSDPLQDTLVILTGLDDPWGTTECTPSFTLNTNLYLC